MSEERGKIECPFCRSDNNIPINLKKPLASIGYTPESHWREDADPEFKYNHSEWTIYIRSGRTSVQFRIFFCPICGRKLPEKRREEQDTKKNRIPYSPDSSVQWT